MCPPGDESFLHKLKSHHLSNDIKLKVMWQKVRKVGKASASCYFFPFQLIQSRKQSCYDQTSETPETTQNQLIFILKHVFSGSWTKHMNSKWGNLGKCGLEGTKGDPNRVLSKGSKVDTWLGVVQSALGNSDSSCSISKIISLKHALIPSAKANQHSMLKPETQLWLPKTAKNF